MLAGAIDDVRKLDTCLHAGRIHAVKGMRIDASGPNHAMTLGAIARIGHPNHGPRTELVGFRKNRAVLLAADRIDRIAPGQPVYFTPDQNNVRPSEHWLGRVIDAFAEPVDGGSPIVAGARPRPICTAPPPAASRARVLDPMHLGVRAMDVFAPCARGQRLGLFSGSGVGKSSLLAMLARNCAADVVVIGLIGERGREVREFVEDTLGTSGLMKAVVVTATSDEPAARRRRAGWLTMSIAEYFRDQGRQVLCLLDSVTRFALAQREIGLAAGEPPTTRGYTPSVFAELPSLLERAGPGAHGPGTATGSVTGLFTVLVEGDDHNEPISDAVRGILDGHVVLSRRIAQSGRYPAVDIAASLSRLETVLLTADQIALVRQARAILATYAEMEEMIRIGAYTPGADSQTDRSVRLAPVLNQFLSQSAGEAVTDDAFTRLADLLNDAPPPARIDDAPESAP